MRRFELHRHADPTGVSGTGTVAEGAQFTDGTVALRWLSTWPATTVHPSITSVVMVHGHHGATNVHWLDPEETRS